MTEWQREQLARTITNPRCAAGDSICSALTCVDPSARKIAIALAINARPMPSCTTFCITLGNITPLPPISHPRAAASFILGRRERHAGHWLDPDQVIPHLLDAGNVFSGYDQAGTFSIIGDHPVQFSDTGIDDHVDMGRPILFSDGG